MVISHLCAVQCDNDYMISWKWLIGLNGKSRYKSGLYKGYSSAYTSAKWKVAVCMDFSITVHLPRPSTMTNIDAIWQDLVCLSMFMCYIQPSCGQKQLFLSKFFLHYESATREQLDPRRIRPLTLRPPGIWCF
jgi:hypothetical protein